MNDHLKPIAAHPKSRRRWLRISLRMMLVAVTLLCVALGFISHRANRQRSAVDAIMKAGGRVSYNYECYESGARYVDNSRQPPGPAWLRGILGIDYFDNVAAVSLPARSDANAAAEQDAIARFDDLPHIRLLSVSDDAALAQLRGLPELQWLELIDSQVTDFGLMAGA